jgi:hypothetical protein
MGAYEGGGGEDGADPGDAVTTRAWTLPAAAWLAAGEAAVLIVVVALTKGSAAPLVIGFLAAKFPFCWLVVRLRPGAYLGLLVWELAGVVAAVSGRGVAIGLRLAEVVVAASVTALLVASTPLFPTVRLPESQS